MPSLISGAALDTSSPSGYITLGQTQYQLGPTPTTSTGYTLITNSASIVTYTSSLGNIQFSSGTLYSNVLNQTLTLIGTGTTSVLVQGGTTATNTNTGALIVQGDIAAWGTLYTGEDIHVNGLTIGQGWQSSYHNLQNNNIAITGILNTATNNTTDGENSIVIGYNTLNGLSTALKTIAVGNNAASTGTDLSNTIAIGDSALKNIGTVHAIPVNFIQSISTSGSNLYLEFSSYNSDILITGTYVTIVGATSTVMNDTSIATLNGAGFYAQPIDNTHIQLFRDVNVTYPSSGANIDASAYQTNSGQIALETSYNDNIAIGTDAAINLINGQMNFFLGDRLATNLTTGSYNLFIGHETANNMTKGSGNISIAGDNLVDGVDNQINIGALLYYDGLGYTQIQSNLGAGLGTWATATTFISTITAASNSNPVIIQHTLPNGISTGTEIIITGVQGMTQINDQIYFASHIDSTTFGLYYDWKISQPVDGTGYGTYIPASYPVVGSLVFDGTTSWIYAPSNSAFALGSTWTIEFWSNATSNSIGTVYPILCQQPLTTSIDVGFINGFLLYGDTTTSISEPNPNQWTHVAIVANVGTVTVYYNGTYQGQIATGVNLTDSSLLDIGTRGPTHFSQYFAGNLSNIRITKGVAVYTGAFTTPTVELAATQSASTNISAITGIETSLLLNVETSGTAFTDNSTYRFTLTNNGTTYSSSGPGLTYGALAGGGAINALEPTGALSILGGVGIAGNLIVTSEATFYRGIKVVNEIIGTISTATNLANGITGSIPYQSSTGTTSFIGIGANGTVLQSNGSTATWVIPSFSANSSTSVLINTVFNHIYYPTLSITTNTWTELSADSSLSYVVTSTNTSSYFTTGTNILNVPGSIYSSDGNPQQNYLLYTPKITISTNAPDNPNVGDFWINTTYGVELQYVDDGGNTFWIQFTTGL